MSEVVVGGRDFAEVVRGILQRSSAKDLGGVAIGPGADGFIRLTSFFASAEVAAEGEWRECVEVSGRLLRNLVKGDAAAVMRVGFGDGGLRVEGVVFTASVIAGEDAAGAPRRGRGRR